LNESISGPTEKKRTGPARQCRHRPGSTVPGYVSTEAEVEAVRTVPGAAEADPRTVEAVEVAPTAAEGVGAADRRRAAEAAQTVRAVAAVVVAASAAPQAGPVARWPPSPRLDSVLPSPRQPHHSSDWSRQPADHHRPPPGRSTDGRPCSIVVKVPYAMTPTR
jgi:hypothetical protein